MKIYKNFILPYLIWAGLIIIIPLIMILIYAFTTDGNTVLTVSFTLDNFKNILSPSYISVFWTSLKVGIITVLICLVLGYIMAYLISRFSEQVQSILILMVTIPMWINMLLRTYAWISILSENGLFNSFLGLFDIEPMTLMYTDFAVILGLVCDFLPFMIIPIHTSLSKMDKSLIEASYDLGANKFQTFKKVIFKLSLPGVINGIIMVFLLSISSFVIPKLLGGGNYMMVGNLIESQFVSVGDWNFGGAISFVLAAIMLVAIKLTEKFDKTDE